MAVVLFLESSVHYRQAMNDATLLPQNIMVPRPRP